MDGREQHLFEAGQWEGVCWGGVAATEPAEHCSERLSPDTGVGQTIGVNPMVCGQCGRDVSALPAAAQFCPTCGCKLPELGYAAGTGTRRGTDAAENDGHVRPPIVLAYAGALANLGWRYEHGRGVMRNQAEARRCYAKAGRLRSTLSH